MSKIMLFDPARMNEIIKTQVILQAFDRLLGYLKAGYPVNLRGPVGIGKTTLAIHLAQSLGRPIAIIFGNDKMDFSDVLGVEKGYRKKAIVDNFIHSVSKIEEIIEQNWIDGKIITACQNGHTLIYDDFNRSSPALNSILLPVLEEKVLQLPITRNNENLINVHPDFKMIFTSNFDDYEGVYKIQEALLDRMITVKLDYWDRDTELEITAVKTGLTIENAAKIVDIIRKFREAYGDESDFSLRNAIMIGKIVKRLNIQISSNEPLFVQICEDVLQRKLTKNLKVNVEDIIGKVLTK